MADREDKTDFSLKGFAKNALIGVAVGFFYGFMIGLREDNSYHFAVIVGAHTFLSGLLAGSLSYSIFSSNLLQSFPRLKHILNGSMYFGVFSGIGSFIVNTSPYTNNSAIMVSITDSLLSDVIMGALGGLIFSFIYTLINHEAT
ncbi:MAG: hypothetical protein GY777_12175 [Candidatus Brocadiaceae bacterium]|nr:hypothetical protein [Candidatus Brocadiaceae bacterium]